MCRYRNATIKVVIIYPHKNVLPAKNYPLHRRIALHPMTALFLLAVGVYIGGSAFQARADSLDVTAIVHAPSLTTAATITSFFDQQHTPNEEGEVAGTCPDNSYVKLFSNDVEVGVSSCDDGTYSIDTNFAPGANKLQVKAYNVTDDEGPFNPPITVYYDSTVITSQTPVVGTPPQLKLLDIDDHMYKSGVLPITGPYPTFSGFASPHSTIVVTVHSNVVECRTVASSTGWWLCTLAQPLEPGIHTLNVVAVAADGTATALPTTHIEVVAGRPSVLKSKTHLAITVTPAYKYQIKIVGSNWQWQVRVAGGVPPYKVTVDWGDSSTNTYTTDGSGLSVNKTYRVAGSFKPVVRVTDSGGNSAAGEFQLLAIVKPLDVAATTSAAGIAPAIIKYLWFIWPIYGVIVLMVISFWLGELEIKHKAQ